MILVWLLITTVLTEQYAVNEPTKLKSSLKYVTDVFRSTSNVRLEGLSISANTIKDETIVREVTSQTVSHLKLLTTESQREVTSETVNHLNSMSTESQREVTPETVNYLNSMTTESQREVTPETVNHLNSMTAESQREVTSETVNYLNSMTTESQREVTSETVNHLNSMTAESQREVTSETVNHLNSMTTESQREVTSETVNHLNSMTTESQREVTSETVNHLNSMTTESQREVTSETVNHLNSMTTESQREVTSEIVSNYSADSQTQTSKNFNEKEQSESKFHHYIIDGDGCHEVDIAMNSYICAFGLFGIIGNSISISILQKIKTKYSSSFLLSVLAFWDSAFVFSTIVMKPGVTLLQYFDSVQAVQKIITYLYVYGYKFLQVALFQCAWVTVLVTFHRYVGKCTFYKRIFF